MANDYWHRILDSRVSRRRGMAALGASAAAAAFLAACGGSDSGSGGKSDSGAGDKSGLITKPVDTTKSAKKGGTLKFFTGSEPAHLDVQMDQVAMNQHKNMVYGHFVNDKAGVLKPPTYEEVVGEMMQSWEWSPDRLTLTFKMRDGVKWHNKAPVNGRVMDTEDVLFSWQRFATKGTDRSFLVNAANPNAPVLSVTAPDAKTIQFKLKEPVVFLLAALTPDPDRQAQHHPEGDREDLRHPPDMIGTGPFVLDKYTPTVGFTYKRNPDYWDKDFPLVDPSRCRSYGVRTGAGTAQGRQPARLRVRHQQPRAQRRHPAHEEGSPELKLYSAEPTATTVRSVVFGWPNTDANKPFKDERVRQAFSMTWDRDPTSRRLQERRQVQRRRPAGQHLLEHGAPAGLGSWWLDPKGKDFGPNAKYFTARRRRSEEAVGRRRLRERRRSHQQLHQRAPTGRRLSATVPGDGRVRQGSRLQDQAELD